MIIDDAIRAAAEEISDDAGHIESGVTGNIIPALPSDDIHSVITRHLRPLFEQQQEIIKHQIEDQVQLEDQLDQLVGSTAQGDSHGMESIYDVVERRWKEQQADIERLKVMLAKSVDIAASIQCWTKDEASHSYEDDSQYSHGWSDCRCAIENKLNQFYHQFDKYTEWVNSFHDQCHLNLEEADSEIERHELTRIREAVAKSNDETCQALAQALGHYPWYKDDQKNFPGADESNGVCYGDHVPETLSAEAAGKIKEQQAEIERLKAEAAEMRDLLEYHRDGLLKLMHKKRNDGTLTEAQESEGEANLADIEKALSGTAGQALLDELRQLRKRVEELEAKQ